MKDGTGLENVSYSIESAHAQAESVIREHSKTFYFASALLPRRSRAAVRSLYGFCRRTDDLVDRGNATVEDIERWRAQVSLPTVGQTDPILISWAATRGEFGIDRRYEGELIDGVRMDISPRLFSTWADLKQYCYLVASTVGLLSLPILGLARGASLPVAKSHAVALGIALQLTNILRDVGEDADRGRVYLPLEDLRRFGVAEKEIRRKTLSDRFAALMQFEIQRARALYREALPGIALLSRTARPAVGAAALLYRAILDEIEALRYDVFSRRAHLSSGMKILRMPRILFTVMSLQAPKAPLPE
jgi:phytoene synthase